MDKFVEMVSTAIRDLQSREKTRVIDPDGYSTALKAAKVLSKFADNPDSVNVDVMDIGNDMYLSLVTAPFEVHGELMDEWCNLLRMCSSFTMMATDNGRISMYFTIKNALREI